MVKRLGWSVLLLLVMACLGCVTTTKPVPRGAGSLSAGRAEAPPQAAINTLRSRLDYVIRHNVTAADVPRALGTFTMSGYALADPGTFWGQRALPGSGGSFSEYYLTYRRSYVILLLKDLDENTHQCIDARLFPRTSADYELATGRVQVDDQPIDESVIVLVNRKWSGRSSTDVRAAFRPNAETGRIEDVRYRTIRIFREE